MAKDLKTGGWPGGRRRWRGATLVLLVLVTVAATGCVNVQAGDGNFVMGSAIVVDEDEVARDDLVAIGGSIRVDGTARRDVVVIGGSLTINGEVGRDVVCIGGTLRLGEDAEIGGSATLIGGALQRHPDAEIRGELVNVSIGPTFGGLEFVPWGGPWWFSPFMIFGRITQLLYWLLLGLLTVALVGDRVSSASHAVSREPLRLGAIGLVAFIALVFGTFVLAILSIFIIGIPFLLALIFGWVLAYVFGVVAAFQAVGSRVMRTFGKPDASQIGIVLAGGLVLGTLRFLPFGFGTIIWWVAGFIGLGAVFATRFGTNRPWFRREPLPPPPAGPPPEGPPHGAPPAGAHGGPGVPAAEPPPSGARAAPASPPEPAATGPEEPEAWSTSDTGERGAADIPGPGADDGEEPRG